MKPQASVLWLEAGSGNAPASEKEYCFRCGKFSVLSAALCARCAANWLEERQPRVVPEHEQKITRTYWVSYPEHEPREDDPHYRDFEEYRRRTKGTAPCTRGLERGDFS